MPTTHPRNEVPEKTVGLATIVPLTTYVMQSHRVSILVTATPSDLPSPRLNKRCSASHWQAVYGDYSSHDHNHRSRNSSVCTHNPEWCTARTHLLYFLTPFASPTPYKIVALTVDMRSHFLLALGPHTFTINLLRQNSPCRCSQVIWMCFHHMRRQSTRYPDTLVLALFAPQCS